MDNKYVVFKRDEFRDWFCTVGDHSHGVNVLKAVEDAVVIRRQDAFAPPALDAYANAITVALELIKEGVTSNPKAVALRDIADYFHQQAALAWSVERKLPD
jgi:hypothetical protein